MEQRLAPAQVALPRPGQKHVDKGHGKRPQPADLADSVFCLLDFHAWPDIRHPEGDCTGDDILRLQRSVTTIGPPQAGFGKTE
ncbi:hypothetical protein, partial [Rhodovulum sulfidophilum]|uniref:hypothetical protein n=1 Tax=Rhodovulum sulfidophilum TaxID=35806 RepID=UPI001F3D4C06